jgi:hypothetical protein
MFTRSISALGAVAMAAATLFLATPASAAPAAEDSVIANAKADLALAWAGKDRGTAIALNAN